MDALKLESLPHYTYEDYKRWEGDWELIYGVPHAMAPSPVKIHQKLMGRIFSLLDEMLKECPECEVLPSMDWKVRSDLVLRPDVAVVCRDMETRYIAKTPEVVFEIFGLSTADRDENLKYAIYEREGVKYYILVYPEELTAKVFENREDGFEKVGDYTMETLDFTDVSCPVTFDFDKLFSRFR
ncbi:Uma2 family endonuclease [Hydrogenimonas sp.]